ncbi:hypothetical protein KQX66_36375, partial [Paenibacillus sp. SM 69]|nr:hypothetical protein [Paenibacillus oleatilyticus]
PMPQPFSAAQKPQPYEAPQPFQAAQKGKPEPMPQPFSAAQKPQPYEAPQPFQAAQKGKPEPMSQPFSAAQKPQPYEAPQPFQAAQKGKPEPMPQPYEAPQPFQAAQKGKPEPMPQPFSAAQKPQPYEAPQPFQAAQKGKPSEPALNPYEVAQPQPGYQPFQFGSQPPQPSASLFQQYNVPAVGALAQPPQQPYGKGKENVGKEPELPPIPQMPGTGTMPYFTAPAAPPAYPSLSTGHPPVVKSGCGCGGGLADLPYALPPKSPSFAQMPEQASFVPQWSQTAPISLEPPLPQPYFHGPFQPYGHPPDEYPLMPFAGPGPLFCEPVVPFHGYPGFPSYPGYVSPAVSPYGSPYPWEHPQADDKGREGEEASRKSAPSEKAVISQTDTRSEPKAARPPKQKKKQSSARAAISSLIERNRRQSARSAKPRKPLPWLGN